jgi:hopanoid biosynthesis associated radical SAM protein HpnH
MAVQVRQSTRMGWYLMRQRLAKREKFPLIVELEPLFQCNLACSGCGKIQHPEHELRRRMPVAQAVGAIEESGAPMVSIAGGEPLIHPEIHVIADELVKRKKFVYLCTNALLLERKLENFTPSPYFSWAVHVDGLRERHDESVERVGVFDKAVAAIKTAKAAGFRVTTNTTFFTHDSPKTVREVLDFLNDDLGVDEMMISPAYAYEKAPDQDHFLGVKQTRALFSEAFADGRRKKWRLNHSPLFLDFLEGKADFDCTAWGIPSYSLFGWQRPCYLMADGYTKTYKELIETTDWSKYGRGKDPRCENCMAHCGYEPTAVLRTTRSLRQSLRAIAG